MGIFNKKDKVTKKATAKPAADVAVAAASTAKADSKKSTAKKVSHGQSRFAQHILRPIISEKAARLHSYGQYVFAVSPSANKVMIKQALKDMYNVDAVHVSIVKNPTKYLRRRHGIGQTKERRKAVVRLKSGQSINIYEGI